MRKIILCFIVIAYSLSCSSQVADAASIITNLFGGVNAQVVHDPTAKAQTAQLLASTKNAVESANKQIDLLRDAQAKMKKVTDKLKQVKYIQDIILIQQRIYTLSQNTLRDAREMDILYHEKVMATITAYNALAIATESTLNFANTILQDDFFEMSTADRMDILIRTRQEVQDHYATAKELSRLVYEVGTLNMLNKAYNRVESKNKKIIGGYKRLGDN